MALTTISKLTGTCSFFLYLPQASHRIFMYIMYMYRVIVILMLYCAVCAVVAGSNVGDGPP